MTDWIEKGKTVFVRGPKDSYVGRVVSFPGPRLVELEDASWVSDSGRFHEFMRAGRAANMDIEPLFNRCVVSWNDIAEWPHPLFSEAI